MTIVEGITNRVLSIVGSALILMFFSEFFFMNEGPVDTVMSLRTTPGTAIIGLVETTAYYALAAWAFLLLLPSAQQRGMAGVFLVACLYGWITEGAIVPVVHEAPPISWIWTSVSWHAPIDVFLGLYLLRQVLCAPTPWASVALHAATGIAWGLWSTWTWSEPKSQHLSGSDFLFFTVVTSGIWALGLVLLSRARVWHSVAPERWSIFLIVWALGLLWAAAALPLSIGPLALSALALWMILRPGETDRQSADLPAGAFPVNRLWHVVLAAITATGTVWLCDGMGWMIPTEEITAAFFMAGSAALIWAYWQAFTLR